MGFNSRRHRWFNSGASLNPTPDGGVVGGDAPLAEEFLDVAIGKGESQIPAHRTGNDGRFEVAPFEQRWPGFAHQGMISGPRQPPSSFATLPCGEKGLCCSEQPRNMPGAFKG